MVIAHFTFVPLMYPRLPLSIASSSCSFSAAPSDRPLLFAIVGSGVSAGTVGLPPSTARRVALLLLP